MALGALGSCRQLLDIRDAEVIPGSAGAGDEVSSVEIGGAATESPPVAAAGGGDTAGEAATGGAALGGAAPGGAD